MNVLTIVMFGAGVTLLYAGIKNLDPRDVVKSALAGESPSEPKHAPGFPPLINQGNDFPKPEDTGTARI